ncbi:hypothetical protein NQ314_007524, partial [Rhamnusium bicolor]
MVVSMTRWVDKVAVVTGASAGIGREITKELVKQGLKVVGVARRVELIEALAIEIKRYKGKLYPLKCDVMKEEDVENIFQWIKENLGPVHIMINNAGVFTNTNLIEGDVKLWKQVLDTNVLGLCIGTREAVKNMRANNIDGHIIHINSIGGHVVPYFYASNVYPASKHGVTALTETLRRELTAKKLNIKITSISPGIVRTDIMSNCNEELIELFASSPALQSEDVVDAVIYALSTGPNVQVILNRFKNVS